MLSVIILAGGKGTRLKSIIDNIPKPMALVNNKPFIYYLLKQINTLNISKTIVSLGYKSEIIVEYLNNFFQNANIQVTTEEYPLLTGGAIRLALSFANTNDVLIINGDSFFDIDILDFYNFHNQNNSQITIALKEMQNFDRYGEIQVDHSNRILKFEEKKYCNKGYINAGYILLKRHLLNDFELNTPFSFESDFLEKNIGKLDLFGFIQDKYFVDIGIPEDYHDANNYFKLNYNNF